jgi:RNA polymerase sigma-70 factor (ECF subfamily)
LTTSELHSIYNGDTEARLGFYRVYSHAVFKTAYRVLGNKQEAEDVMHDVFLKAFEKLNTLLDPSAVGGWLRSMAFRASIDALRSKREIDFPLSEEYDDTPPESYYHLNTEQVLAAMAQLPEGYRIIINLHLLEELTFDEIADLLGIQPSTARSQYARGRIRLKNLLIQLYA